MRLQFTDVERKTAVERSSKYHNWPLYVKVQDMIHFSLTLQYVIFPFKQLYCNEVIYIFSVPPRLHSTAVRNSREMCLWGPPLCLLMLKICSCSNYSRWVVKVSVCQPDVRTCVCVWGFLWYSRLIRVYVRAGVLNQYLWGWIYSGTFPDGLQSLKWKFLLIIVYF